jgi:hypothetical protein
VVDGEVLYRDGKFLIG